LSAHQSQVQNFAMLAGGPERFAEWFGQMAFALGDRGAWDGGGSSGAEAPPGGHLGGRPPSAEPPRHQPLDDLFAPPPPG
ncbi:MAG TPA: hypothetical protein VMD59_15270, partial [Acidimicrobiales bacterium]|nr:hypothetical protein [Acidimicrobiales bacterium]